MHFFAQILTELCTLLKFIIGMFLCPPMGLETPIELVYLPLDEKQIFHKAQSYFSKLYLPTIYDS